MAFHLSDLVAARLEYVVSGKATNLADDRQSPPLAQVDLKS